MDWTQIAVAALGGGGAYKILERLWHIVRDRHRGDLLKEDTAISRWKAIADERQQDEEKAERERDEARRETAHVKQQYSILWAAYQRLPVPEGFEKPEFPPYPPSIID